MLLLAAFGLVSVVALLVFYWTFGGSRPFSPKPYTFSVPLADAQTLVAGADVQISGVKIGRVEQVVRDGNSARAVVGLDGRFAPIRSGATAILRTKTLLGEAYIEIAPGPRAAPILREGEELPASQVKRSVPLDQFLESFNPNVVADMRRMFRGFARSLHGRSASLNRALARQEPFSEDLTGMMQALDSQTHDLQTMFRDSGQILRAVGSRAGDVQAAVRAGNEVLAVTGGRERELAAMMRAFPPFLHQVRATSRVISGQSTDFNHAMRDLLPAAKLLRPSLRAVQQNAPALERLFRRLPPTLEAGRRGMPAFAAMLRAMPPGFDQLYPALREFIPLIQLMATYSRPAFITPLANSATSDNGTQVGPQGKILTRPNGFLYNSNETVAGWIKRLPTHRSNPYPKPDAFDELARIGFFKSYDCRNVNNPEYLPPLGDGVPPCVLQGPWTYRGKLAYYPRLELASP